MRALAPREGPWPQAVPQQAPGKFSGKRRRLAWIQGGEPNPRNDKSHSACAAGSTAAPGVSSTFPPRAGDMHG